MPANHDPTYHPQSAHEPAAVRLELCGQHRVRDRRAATCLPIDMSASKRNRIQCTSWQCLVTSGWLKRILFEHTSNSSLATDVGFVEETSQPIFIL